MVRAVSKHLFCVASVLLILIPGCDSPPAPLTEWMGEAMHLRATGEVEGRTIDVDLSGAAAAALTTLVCKREYTVPDELDPATWSGGREVELEIGWNVVEEREVSYQIAFKDHDWTASGATRGDTLALVGEAAATDADTVKLEFEWEYEDPQLGQQQVEVMASEGSFALYADEGSPGADGIVITEGGLVGGFVDARFADDDWLTVSFTAGCGPSDVEIAE